MIEDLDHESSLDPARAGAKAAWLAMGRRSGLPILPGFVVGSAASRHHMAVGASAFAQRGSGGARLVVSSEPIEFAEELESRASALGPAVAARSSTLLEQSAVWSGAFSSYLDLAPEEVAKGVAGCWASAFNVDALERQSAMGIDPGGVAMAVLVQASLSPEFGGAAELAEDGSIVIHAVKGHPGPLLQGWVAGDTARLDSKWSGDALIDKLGLDTLNEIAAILRRAHSDVGADRVEWAIDDGIWVLQLGKKEIDESLRGLEPSPVEETLLHLVAPLLLAPGPLGEQLVLPWAVAGFPVAKVQSTLDPKSAWRQAWEISDRLTSAVWGGEATEGRMVADRALREIRTGSISKLPAEPSLTEDGPLIMGHIEAVGRWLTDQGHLRTPRAIWHMDRRQVETALDGAEINVQHRFGLGRWEPFVASAITAFGTPALGTPAAPGFGAGLAARIEDDRGSSRFAPRDILVSSLPVPPLAPLLWDATGVVTTSGSAAAHFFDSARSLGVPAVTGVEIDGPDPVGVAVDGNNGVVSTIALGSF